VLLLRSRDHKQAVDHFKTMEDASALGLLLRKVRNLLPLTHAIAFTDDPQGGLSSLGPAMVLSLTGLVKSQVLLFDSLAAAGLLDADNADAAVASLITPVALAGGGVGPRL